MSQNWKTVRVFISSTFRDMQAERDHLVQVVFPELKERCRKRHLRLFDVDLRWGVTEEQAEGGGALDICLDTIDSCRPYFLGLLGQRYGYIPSGHTHSITAKEIYHGVLHDNLPRQLMDLRPFAKGNLEGRTLDKEQVDCLARCYQWNPQNSKYLLKEDITPEEVKTLRSIFYGYSIYQKDRSFFFFRSESLTRELAGSKIDDFFEAGEDVKVKLARLKQEIISAGLSYFEYEDVETFGQKVLETLWRSISTEFPEEREETKRDWLKEEAEFHELFMADRTWRFVGRAEILKRMQTFVEEDHDSRVMAIIGEPGCGKSALMARFAEQITGCHRDWLILSHFVGASPSSTSLRQTLRRFCAELNRALGVTEEVPEGYKELAQLFPELLQKTAKTHRILLIVDALNQFEKADNAHAMRWLPQEPPLNVRVVVSTLAGEALDALRAWRIQPRFEELGGLTEPETEQFVNSYLKELGKEFPTPEIRDAFFDKIKAGHPLYILVALEELRFFPLYEEVGKRVDSLPDSVPELFDQVLERIEGVFKDRCLVQDFVSFIACGRQGMTGEELQELLSKHASVVGPERHAPKLPDMLFARLRRAFSDYLFERSGVIDFFHGQLKEAVGRRYLRAESDRIGVHRIIAKYFEHRWREPYLRAVDELPHQLTKAKGWDGVERVLCDLGFVEVKCAAGMTYDLVHDYDAALDALPEAREEMQERLKHEAQLKKYTDDLIAYAKGEIDHLEIIPSVEPWSEEKMRRDTDRIISNPTRLDRIRAFSQFVNSESHALLKFAPFPCFTVQRAYNSARTGPVAYAAEPIVNTETDHVLLLHVASQRPVYSPHPALLKTLEGHKSWVYCVGLTPDGKIAISGSQDNTLRVWDVESGECLRTLQGHTGDVACVSLTPDGKIAVSGSHDMTLRVWDVESGECTRTLQGHTHNVTCVSLTPDGKIAVSGSQDNTLRVWDVESGECLRTLQGHTATVRCVSLTPDGKIAISGGWDPYRRHDLTLRVWDVESGECTRTLKGHTAYVHCVTLTPDGKRAVSVSWDKTLRVWDVESGECIKTLQGHTGSVDFVAPTPDGKRVVSVSWDNTLRVWDVESGECIKTLQHPSGINCVGLTPDGKIVAGEYDTLRVWDLESGECLKTLQHPRPRGIICVGLTPDGKIAVSGSDDNTLRVWDLESGECLRTLQGHTGDVACVSLTPDGKIAVSGSWDNTLRVWDLESGECLRTLQGHTGDVACVSLTPDGKIAVSGGGHELRVWDVESGECLRTLQGHTSYIRRCVDLTPDGKIAISGSHDKTLRVWDVESGECIKTLQGHTGNVDFVELTPDGKTVASGGTDKTLRVWDVESGECLIFLQANGVVRSISSLSTIGHFVLGTEAGEVIVIEVRNLVVGTPIVTPVRLWLYKRRNWLFRKEKASSGWDDNITVVCQWCGKRFPVSEEKLNLIRSINRNANLSPDQSPCLELPSEAWKEPRLISECPICHKPLKLNPFIVDNSWEREKKDSRSYTDSKQSQDKAQQWYDNGYSLFGLGRYDEALKCYDKALEINPQQAKIWSSKGLTLFVLGRYYEAIKCCDRALEINPQHADAWNNKGVSLNSLGRYHEAIECYDNALEINPQQAAAWSNKGDSLMRLGRYHEAIKCCDRALEINPQLEITWYNKGGSLNSLGRYHEAIKCYDKALEINPKQALTWYNKGVSLNSLDRYHEAIKCCDRALEINPQHADAWNNKGGSLFCLDRYYAAIKCYDKVLEIKPQYALAWFNKGSVEDQLGLRRDAAISYRKFIELAPAQHAKYIEIARKRLRELEGR